MKCDKVGDEIKAYVDGELGRLARWRVGRHIAACSKCRAELELVRRLTREVRSAEAVSAPPALRGKVLQQIQFQPAGLQRKRAIGLVPAAAATLLVLLVGAVVLVHPGLGRRHKGTGAPSAEVAKSDQVHLAAPEPAKGPYAAPSAAKPASSAEKERPASPASGSPPGWRRMPSSGMPAASVPPLPPVTGAAPSRAPLVRVHGRNAAAAKSPMPSSRPSAGRAAELTIDVVNCRQAYDRAASICRSAGGSVLQAPISKTVQKRAQLVLRVPADSAESVLQRLAALSTAGPASPSRPHEARLSEPATGVSYRQPGMATIKLTIIER